MSDFKFSIVREIGVLSSKSSYGDVKRKELNVVSWNGRDPLFDIRTWNEDHTSMSKGITLTRDEIRKLYTLIKDYAEA